MGEEESDWEKTVWSLGRLHPKVTECLNADYIYETFFSNSPHVCSFSAEP